MTSKKMLNEGEKWTDVITRYAMPILLWCAKNGKKITYGELEHEISLHHPITIQRVKTKYGHLAAKIGDIIFEAAEEMNEDIPPINAIIVRKDSGVPGKSVDDYIRRFVELSASKKNAPENQGELINEVIQAVFDYPHWQNVARHLGYKKLSPAFQTTTFDDTQPIKAPVPKRIKRYEGYNSSSHELLKENITNSPALFKEFGEFYKGRMNYLLRSGDEVDVVFENNEMILAVEVEAADASESELVRGIYRCIKYRATLRAMQLADGDMPNAQSVFATANPLTGEVKRLAKRLRVHWIRVKQ